MVIININGINGNSFIIDTTKQRKNNKYYLHELKNDIFKHLKKNTEIFKDDDEYITTEKTEYTFSQRHITEYIDLVKNNMILNNPNFNDDELKDGDIINYIIKPRYN